MLGLPHAMASAQQTQVFRETNRMELKQFTSTQKMHKMYIVYILFNKL